MIARAETISTSLTTSLIAVGVIAIAVALSVVAGFILARRARGR
jgi:hypothetical protein